MKQYLDLLQNIIDNGVEKESGRANMPNTIGISKADIRMDLADGFPLLTTKKMYWKGIVHELLWFLRGETNIKYLVENSVYIWVDDAYRWYLKYAEMNSPSRTQNDIMFENPDGSFRVLNKGEFVEVIKTSLNVNELPKFEYEYNKYYVLGDLGKVYGHQWRNQNDVDQVKDVIEGLKSNPYSRYHIINGWSKADFPEMALPPCHLLYQFIVRPLSLDERRKLYANKCDYNEDVLMEFDMDFYNEKKVPKFYLDLNMYQRSCDTFLGVPFNIASMSLLLLIFAKASNMVAGVANWIGGDTHLYVSHVETAKEQISREPFPLATMKINKEINTLNDILELSIDDFEISNYVFRPTLKAELFTGLKK